MPIAIIEVDRARRRVYAAGVGALTGADVRAHVERRALDEVLEYAELLDLDGASVDGLTGAEVWDVAGTIKQLGAQRRIGPLVVVAAADVTYGLVRMYEQLTDETRPIRVARTRAEAEAWLDAVAGGP
jgi:hypothetical protein